MREEPLARRRGNCSGWGSESSGIVPIVSTQIKGQSQYKARKPIQVRAKTPGPPRKRAGKAMLAATKGRASPYATRSPFDACGRLRLARCATYLRFATVRRPPRFKAGEGLGVGSVWISEAEFTTQDAEADEPV